MTLTELYYIVMISKYQHFGEASKPPNVSQPAL